MAIIECKEGVPLVSIEHMNDLLETSMGRALPPAMKKKANAELEESLNRKCVIFCSKVCAPDGQCQAKKYEDDGPRLVAHFLVEQVLEEILEEILTRGSDSDRPAPTPGGTG